MFVFKHPPVILADLNLSALSSFKVLPLVESHFIPSLKPSYFRGNLYGENPVGLDLSNKMNSSEQLFILFL